METLHRDLRFALRGLRRRPVFAAVAVLSLALGIGANGTIFSLVNGLLLKPPPGVRDADELVRIYAHQRSFDWPLGVSVPNYRDVEEATGDLVTNLSGHVPNSFGVAQGNEPPKLRWGQLVVGDYFATLGTTPHLGRFFGRDEVEARQPMVVLSYPFWQQLGSDPELVGRPLQIDGQSFTVAAVTPPGFFGTEVIWAPELWLPFHSSRRTAELAEERASDPLRVTGRLRPGGTLDALEARLEALSVSLAEEYPEANRQMTLHAMPDSEARIEAGLGGPMKLISAILLALVGLVLLIACANVANLMLARASARRRELSLRVAMGAGGGQLVRQLGVESLIIASAGGLAGAFIASWAARAVEGWDVPSSLPLRLELTPDYRVYTFTALVSLLAGLVFALAPALRVSRTDPMHGLRESAAGFDVARGLRLGNSLVVAQVAFSLVLLVGAGLFLRSLQRAQAVDMGLDPEGIVALTVDLSLLERSVEEGRQFFDEAQRRLGALPGVEAVTVASWVPLDWNASGTSLGVGRDLGQESGDDLLVLGSWVAPGYFEMLRTPILAGRGFTDADDRDKPAVIIVNEALAHLAWPGESALGKQVRLTEFDDQIAEVIGVARNGKYRLLGESPRPYFFLPLEQQYRSAATLLLRSDQAPGPLLALARAEIASLEPDLAIYSAQPLAASITSRALGPIRLVAVLAGAFGLVGVTLAAIGLYGVMAFNVSQRSREIGIRMALGARVGQVMGRILGRGLTLAAVGVLIGVVGSLALTRVLGSFLVGVDAHDPATFAAVVLGLVAVALLASLVPALRAAQVDPVRTLKD